MKKFLKASFVLFMVLGMALPVFATEYDGEISLIENPDGTYSIPLDNTELRNREITGGLIITNEENLDKTKDARLSIILEMYKEAQKNKDIPSPPVTTLSPEDIPVGVPIEKDVIAIKSSGVLSPTEEDIIAIKNSYTQQQLQKLAATQERADEYMRKNNIIEEIFYDIGNYNSIRNNTSWSKETENANIISDSEAISNSSEIQKTEIPFGVIFETYEEFLDMFYYYTPKQLEKNNLTKQRALEYEKSLTLNENTITSTDWQVKHLLEMSWQQVAWWSVPASIQSVIWELSDNTRFYSQLDIESVLLNSSAFGAKFSKVVPYINEILADMNYDATYAHLTEVTQSELNQALFDSLNSYNLIPILGLKLSQADGWHYDIDSHAVVITGVTTDRKNFRIADPYAGYIGKPELTFYTKSSYDIYKAYNNNLAY